MNKVDWFAFSLCMVFTVLSLHSTDKFYSAMAALTFANFLISHQHAQLERYCARPLKDRGHLEPDLEAVVDPGV